MNKKLVLDELKIKYKNIFCLMIILKSIYKHNYYSFKYINSHYIDDLYVTIIRFKLGFLKSIDVKVRQKIFSKDFDIEEIILNNIHETDYEKYMIKFISIMEELEPIIYEETVKYRDNRKQKKIDDNIKAEAFIEVFLNKSSC